MLSSNMLSKSFTLKLLLTLDALKSLLRTPLVYVTLHVPFLDLFSTTKGALNFKFIDYFVQAHIWLEFGWQLSLAVRTLLVGFSFLGS